MYRIGWGFHAELQQLAAAALIWQRGIKPFRLVRQRHLARLRSGEDSVNLASLPLELMNLIEDEIFDNVFEAVVSQEPFQVECTCSSFRRGFVRWTTFGDAIEDYAHNFAIDKAIARKKPSQDGETVSTADLRLRQSDYEVGLVAFCDTEQYTWLRQEYHSIHVAEDECRAEKDKHTAWVHVLAKRTKISQRCRHNKEVSEILDALCIFEGDFGLLRLCPRYDADGLPEIARIPVFFRSHSQLGRQRTRNHEMLLLAPVNPTKLVRFLVLFGLESDTEASRWFTAHLMDLQFGEVAVDCKTVQEVEEHNSLLRMKHQRKANERRKTLAIQAEK